MLERKFFSNETETRKVPEKEEKRKGAKELVLYNDEYNTFDHVIGCLIEICDHDAIQAEQCSLIVHHNGKCGVKVGDEEELSPMCHQLSHQGLTAEVQ